MSFHFRDYLLSAVAYVSQWFNARRKSPEIVEQVKVEEPTAKAPKKRNKIDVADLEKNGSFYLRGAILDDLDRYMTYIRRMRRSDHEAYSLYSRIGAHVIPAHTMLNESLSSWWRETGNRPAFGAVSLCAEDGDKDRVPVRFAYFQKLDKVGAFVQRGDGDVYRVTCYLDDQNLLKKWKRGVPMAFYIELNAEGELRLLKTFGPVSRRVGVNRKKSANFVRMEWRYPEYPEGGSKAAAKIFSLFADAYYLANLSGFQVRATKNKDTAVFSIADNRAPYFFSDRDDVAGKKKIFHAVRAHRRDVGEKTVNVRMHYRGLRSFSWNGYDIVITVPGLHHAALTDATFAGVELDVFDEDVKGTIDEARLGEWMGAHLLGDQSKQRRAA
jgi:hypothetical protein